MKESIQNEVKSRINKKRGNKYEHKGINQYEKKTKRVVTDRNAEMFEKIVKREEDYTIVLRAKIDGIDRENNCLIEHKNRVNELFKRFLPMKRFFKSICILQNWNPADLFRLILMIRVNWHLNHLLNAGRKLNSL